LLLREKITDEEIILRIEKGDERALEYLYKKNYRMIVRLITKNSGTEEEAKDIFQESLVIFWQKASSKNLNLTSKISTYLYSICQNLWHKELNRKSRLSHEEKDGIDVQDLNSKEQISIIQTCLSELGESCRKILSYYYFDEMSMEDIAKKMGLSNADVAKTKKYKCKKELDELVRKKYSIHDVLD
jgi:RNA polymerase sigma factor (sigma-70 family)